jgi:hypothetical protein
MEKARNREQKTQITEIEIAHTILQINFLLLSQYKEDKKDGRNNNYIKNMNIIYAVLASFITPFFPLLLVFSICSSISKWTLTMFCTSLIYFGYLFCRSWLVI